MAQSDLITKGSVLNILESLFSRYKISYKPEGDVQLYGFCADVPQSIEAMNAEYDIEQVIQTIVNSELLNIPDRGYCINVDEVVQIIRNALGNTSYEKGENLSDDIDKAIAFFTLGSFCKPRCEGKDCPKCNRYQAKRTALIALNFYRKAEDMLTRIAYLKENSDSDEAKCCYTEIETMMKDAYDYANDNANIC